MKESCPVGHWAVSMGSDAVALTVVPSDYVMDRSRVVRTVTGMVVYMAAHWEASKAVWMVD